MRNLAGITLAAAVMFFETPGSSAQSTIPAPIKVMLIGDSITAGKGYCWRFHLWESLQEAGYSQVDFVGKAKDQPYDGDFDKDHEGYGGATADQVLKNSAAGITTERPDFAIIHLGTNDHISQKEPAAKTAQEIGEIVQGLRGANPSVTVFLAKIPFVTADQGAEIEQLATNLSQPESRVLTVDLRTGWRFEPGNDTVDYVHPNLNGVLKIADRMFAVLQPELERRGVNATPPAPAPARPARPNLALGKPGTSSLHQPGHKAAKALDGDWKTLWAADPKTPHWLQVDLGAVESISGAGVIWDSAGAPHGYRLEASLDAITWELLVDNSGAPREVAIARQPQLNEFSGRPARFVRLTVTKVPNASWTKYPASVRELEVYGADN